MSKKFLFSSIFIFFILIGLVPALPAGAYIWQKISSYSAKYALTTGLEEEENVVSVLTVSTSTAGTKSSNLILIDKSDANMFPHFSSSNELRVSRIAITWEAPTAAASTTIKIGVIASTSPSGAITDVSYFDRVSFESNPQAVGGGDPYQKLILDYSPSLMKLGTNGATTTGFITNDKEWASSDWATTTIKLCPKVLYTGVGGTAKGCYPNVKDLVAQIVSQTGTATTTFQTFYHTK